ncbi:MAG TPA: xylulokinase [Candidatus Hydrogenedentes bacterium]|nr:xylulokinase [Candidatus Hydrogenedentota bacterium]
MSVVLGLDIGTSGAKAIAMDETGRLLASALVEYPLGSPKPGWAEQDPADWERAAFEALATLASRVDTSRVKGIGLTGQMHGSVFLDAENRVIRPAILWCDQRTAAQCDWITEKVGATRLIEMVSNPALTGFTAPKIIWLRDEEPAHYVRTRKVLLPKDYIRFVLTGTYATDVADASGTLLFDVKNRCWHRELMSLLGIDPEWMPPAFEGPEITGHLTAAAAAKTGLPAGIPVVAGGGDQAANGVGCGIVRRGVVSASLGTSGVVFAHAEQVSTDPEGRLHTFCHAVPGAWHIMGVVLSAGGALQWFRNALWQEAWAAAKAEGREIYEEITAAAAGAPAGSEGLLFLPYLTGERTPHKDPFARGAFVGLSLRHDRRYLSRAVLEGVAYAMNDSAVLIRNMGVPVDQVRCSGGGARSRLWRQIMADVIDAPMITINVDEGPAYGAAILAAVASGLYGTVEEACDAIIREVDRVEPDAANQVTYAKWFEAYQALFRALAPEYRRIHGLLD